MGGIILQKKKERKKETKIKRNEAARKKKNEKILMESKKKKEISTQSLCPLSKSISHSHSFAFLFPSFPLFFCSIMFLLCGFGTHLFSLGKQIWLHTVFFKSYYIRKRDVKIKKKKTKIKGKQKQKN